MAELELMWERSRAVLRRMLISQTRDPELAADLLQETYLRAHAGMSAYRGGDDLAWLRAIAKNVLLGHARSRKRRQEATTESDLAMDMPTVGSAAHLQAMAIQAAMGDLSPTLRSALTLRHYGGLSYAEISERLKCPEGTARRRVWSAVRQLRSALATATEEMPMRCDRYAGTQLLDYVHGALAADEAGELAAHLGRCDTCRADEAELREMIEALDACDGDHVLLHVVELDAEGASVFYTWGRVTNDSEEPMTEFGIIGPRGLTTEHFAVDGAVCEIIARPWDRDPERMVYAVQLPEPIAPGESFNGAAVSRSTDRSDRAERLPGDKWRYAAEKGTGGQTYQSVLVHAVRLPDGARVLATTPEADEVRKANGNCTVVWRLAPPPTEPKEFAVEYAAPD
ncbi:MAG TPA: sigma-70 family RNA polymerase sigma factor [Armatimonadota bacterium]|nr:sigma-70 family RNA polymerase sigma factor [Armatimonadota bacterium]